MRFALYLAVRNLLRHPGRNILYILGVSITAALLLDMILLSSGLSVSLEHVLREMGYEIRISPRGTLPFETDAQISPYHELRARLARIRGVRFVDAMLANNITVEHHGAKFSAFVIGLQLHRPVLYNISSGSASVDQPGQVLINRYIARDRKIRIGEELRLSIAARSQATGMADETAVRVSGIAAFLLDAEGQYTIAASLPFVQNLIGAGDADPVSIIMLKLDHGQNAPMIAAQINRQFPAVTAYTIETVIHEVDKQLSYFKQFAYILGGISLVVTFVLIFIITTISFHDRIGEIALLRAIGLGQKTIFATILFEGILTSIAAAAFGFILGKLVAVYLDAILKSAPGLPEDFSFFVMQPHLLVRALLTLLLTGFFAGMYPASAAIRLPVAHTLREEIL